MYGKLRSALAVLLLGAASCDATGPGEVALAGTYDMVTANGRRLPAVIIARPGYELILRWASIEFDSEDGYVGTSGYEEVGEGRVISFAGPSSGHYTRAGDRVAFQGYVGHESDEGDDRITGRVSGNRLVLTVDTATLVYVRR